MTSQERKTAIDFHVLAAQAAQKADAPTDGRGFDLTEDAAEALRLSSTAQAHASDPRVADILGGAWPTGHTKFSALRAAHQAFVGYLACEPVEVTSRKIVVTFEPVEVEWEPEEDDTLSGQLFMIVDGVEVVNVAAVEEYVRDCAINEGGFFFPGVMTAVEDSE